MQLPPHHLIGSASRATLDLPGSSGQLHPAGGTVEVVWVEGVAPPSQGLAINGRAKRWIVFILGQDRVLSVHNSMSHYLMKTSKPYKPTPSI